MRRLSYLPILSEDLSTYQSLSDSDESQITQEIILQFQKVSKDIHPYELDQSAKFPDSYLDQLFAIGAFSITLPQRFGGIGGTLREFCNMIVHAAIIDPSVGLILQNHLTAVYLAGKYFPDEWNSTFLSDLDSKKRFFGFSISGWNYDSAKGRNDYYLNYPGMVHFMAGQDGSGQKSFFYSDSGFQASDQETGKDRLGYYSLDFIRMKSDAAPDPNFRTICHLEREHGLIPASVMHLSGVASLSLGIGYKAFSLAQNFSDNRVQFKRKLNQNELIKIKLVKMEAGLIQMRALLFLSGLIWEKDPDAVYLTSLIAKVFSSEHCNYCADECMEINGGGGYMEDTGIPHLVRDSKILELIGPDNPSIYTELQEYLSDPEANFDIITGLSGHYPNELNPLLSDLQNLIQDFKKIVTAARHETPNTMTGLKWSLAVCFVGLIAAEASLIDTAYAIIYGKMENSEHRILIQRWIQENLEARLGKLSADRQ